MQLRHHDERPFRDRRPPKRYDPDAPRRPYRMYRDRVKKENARRAFAGWLRNTFRTQAEILKHKRVGVKTAGTLSALSAAWQVARPDLDQAEAILATVVMKDYTPPIRAGVLFLRRPATLPDSSTNLYALVRYGPAADSREEVMTYRECQRVARSLRAVALFIW